MKPILKFLAQTSLFVIGYLILNAFFAITDWLGNTCADFLAGSFFTLVFIGLFKAARK